MRRAAAFALGTTVCAFFACACREQEPAARRQAGENLGAPFPALIQALGDTDQDARLRAADELARRGPDAVAPLLAALEAASSHILQERNQNIRAAAIDALGKMGADAVPAILERQSEVWRGMQRKIEDEHRALQAGRPVISMESPLQPLDLALSQVLTKMGEQAVPKLAMILDDPEQRQDVRVVAAYALANQALTTLGEAALRRAARDPSKEVRRAADNALKSYRHPPGARKS